MKDKEAKNLQNEGYCILKNQISPEWIGDLKIGVEKAFVEHRQIQLQNDNDITTDGVALHAILSDPIFISFLYELRRIELFKHIKSYFFKSNFILNSFSALDNLPHKPNFSGIVHRDCRFFSNNIPIMLNTLVLLDDFTKDNGPTLLLPYSHREEEKPSDEDFFENSVQTLGRAGDIILFDSNVWHASSKNQTPNNRKALPITFTKPNIKQLLDYPRAIGYEKMDNFDKEMQQLLGYHSRVPSNLDEWYQPAEKRFYRE